MRRCWDHGQCEGGSVASVSAVANHREWHYELSLRRRKVTHECLTHSEHSCSQKCSTRNMYIACGSMRVNACCVCVCSLVIHDMGMIGMCSDMPLTCQRTRARAV
eukprot:8770530-Pyramimonas_sp.AAC.1